MKTRHYLYGAFIMVTFLFSSCCKPGLIGSVERSVRPQETNNWCWAAVTEMIAENEGLPTNQCDLANHRFGKNNCCNFQNIGSSCPKTNDCNTPGWLELDFAGVKFSTSNTALSMKEIKKQIYCYKNLLGFAYGTSGVVGHVVTIKGYFNINNTDYLVLGDPWSPCNGSERTITYAEYVNPTGTATHWTTWYGTSKK